VFWYELASGVKIIHPRENPTKHQMRNAMEPLNFFSGPATLILADLRVCSDVSVIRGSLSLVGTWERDFRAQT
jgi:hypothetical protein